MTEPQHVHPRQRTVGVLHPRARAIPAVNDGACARKAGVTVYEDDGGWTAEFLKEAARPGSR